MRNEWEANAVWKDSIEEAERRTRVVRVGFDETEKELKEERVRAAKEESFVFIVFLLGLVGLFLILLSGCGGNGEDYAQPPPAWMATPEQMDCTAAGVCK